MARASDIPHHELRPLFGRWGARGGSVGPSQMAEMACALPGCLQCKVQNQSVATAVFHFFLLFFFTLKRTFNQPRLTDFLHSLSVNKSARVTFESPFPLSTRHQRVHFSMALRPVGGGFSTSLNSTQQSYLCMQHVNGYKLQ